MHRSDWFTGEQQHLWMRYQEWTSICAGALFKEQRSQVSGVMSAAGWSHGPVFISERGTSDGEQQRCDGPVGFTASWSGSGRSHICLAGWLCIVSSTVCCSRRASVRQKRILVAVRYYKLSDSVQINTLTMGQCVCVHACVRVWNLRAQTQRQACISVPELADCTWLGGPQTPLFSPFLCRAWLWREDGEYKVARGGTAMASLPSPASACLTRSGPIQAFCSYNANSGVILCFCHRWALFGTCFVRHTHRWEIDLSDLLGRFKIIIIKVNLGFFCGFFFFCMSSWTWHRWCFWTYDIC